jgi:hypothetical protein
MGLSVCPPKNDTFVYNVWCTCLFVKQLLTDFELCIGSDSLLSGFMTAHVKAVCLAEHYNFAVLTPLSYQGGYLKFRQWFMKNIKL